MNKLLRIVLLVAACLALADASYAQSKSRDSRPRFVPGELIVRFKPDKRRSAMAAYRRQFAMEVRRRFQFIDADHIRLPKDVSVEQALKQLRSDPDVEFAEPNYYRRALTRTPNDNQFQRLWALNNTGQIINSTHGSLDADIDAPEAWDTITDCSGTIIAVIDSGIDTNHPDLKNMLWENPDEIPGDNIDNDKNGYVDDIHGWNFIDDNNDIDDSNFHGSHITGIIAAEGDNQFGMSGVCWRSRIIVLKFLDAFGSGSIADEAAAIDYAIAKGARIINASFGDLSQSATESNAIAKAQNADILFVASAGNDGKSNDVDGNAIYPASYPLDNIIAVAMTDQNDQLESLSNYGVKTVDIAAPGSNIYGPIGHSELTYEKEDFESNITEKGWELETPWNWLFPAASGTDQTYSGSGSLSSFGNSAGGFDAAAKSRPLNLSAYRGVMFFFYVKKHATAEAGTLYVETSADGRQWASQPVYLDSDEGVERYDNGLTDAPTSWRKAAVHAKNLDQAAAGFIRFRVHAPLGAAYGGWYIDQITFETLPADYSGSETEYFSYLDGTSTAAPFVTGLAGLLRSFQPSLSYCQVKTAILEGGDPVDDLEGLVASGRRANAQGSLSLAQDPSQLPGTCSQAAITQPSQNDDDGGVCFIQSIMLML